MSSYYKIIPQADGGYLVDYGDLCLPVPPPDMPLRSDNLPLADCFKHWEEMLKCFPPTAESEAERFASKTPEPFVM